MKTRNTVLFTFLVCQFLMGQSPYNYKNFKYPEVKVKGLATAFYLSSFGNNYKNSNKKDYLHIKYDLYGNYNQFSNSASVQKSDSWLLSNRYENNNEWQFLNNIPIDGFYFNLSKVQVNRKYIDQEATLWGMKQRFLEFNHQISADIYKSNNVNNENLSQSYFATTPVKIGIGRIEPMTDVILAQFLMDDLLESGIIPEKFSEEKLFELAQLMSTLRNQRVFDFRRARIYQLTEIANWMEKNDIIQNIKSFAVLNDNWQYAAVNSRRHGKRISVGLAPWLFQQFSNNYDYPFTFGVGMDIEYLNTIPTSQFSQNDFSLVLSHDFQKSKAENNHISQLSLKNRYSYNPNSRTTYAIGPEFGVVLKSFSDLGYILQIPVIVDYFINNKARIEFYTTPRLNINASIVPSSRQNFSRFNTNIYNDFLLFTPYDFPILISADKFFSLYSSVIFRYTFF